MLIGLYGRVLHDHHINFLQLLIDSLIQKDFDFKIHQLYFPKIKDKVKFGKEPELFDNDSAKELDYLFTLGGDGTLLDSIRIVKNKPVKVLGINMGRLGFLANVNKSDLQNALSSLEKEEYVLDERTLLELQTNNPVFDSVPFALNEFTIYKKDTSSMITVHAYLDGEFLNTYWADGVIVATPTGSTGYSLSCGGPVIYPNSNNFVITPIAPHNLNVRPFVVGDNVHLSFEVQGRTEEFQCTLDSRNAVFGSEQRLVIKKADFKLQLIKMPGNSFLETLRDKLHWGLDSRKYQ